MLHLRRTHIIPRLKGAVAERAEALGPKAIRASWRMGDGAILSLFCDLGPDPVTAPTPRGELIWDRDGARCWIAPP
jgi:hypothetical protein